MKRYQSLFDCIFTGSIKEAIINPKYMQELIQLLKDNQPQISTHVFSFKMAEILSKILKSYKIDFEIINDISSDRFLKTGRYDHTTMTITLFGVYNNLYKIIQSEESFNKFLKEFKELAGHELIHREQYVKDVSIFLTHKATDDIKTYLSDKKEIMAYAWQIVEYMRYSLTDHQIYSLLKSDNSEKYEYHNALFQYHKHFTIQDKELQLFYKYMYLYLGEK